MQDLELRPVSSEVLSELLREMLLRRDGARHTVGCWSWELEDAGGAACLRLYSSWRLSSCGRTRVPEPVSWESVGDSGGGVPALAAVLPPAPDGSAGRSAAGCSVLVLKHKAEDNELQVAELKLELTERLMTCMERFDPKWRNDMLLQMKARELLLNT
jgi:hypothetical protein